MRHGRPEPASRLHMLCSCDITCTTKRFGASASHVTVFGQIDLPHFAVWIRALGWTNRRAFAIRPTAGGERDLRSSTASCRRQRTGDLSQPSRLRGARPESFGELFNVAVRQRSCRLGFARRRQRPGTEPIEPLRKATESRKPQTLGRRGQCDRDQGDRAN
jgi:hypothetical protein